MLPTSPLTSLTFVSAQTNSSSLFFCLFASHPFLATSGSFSLKKGHSVPQRTRFSSEHQCTPAWHYDLLEMALLTTGCFHCGFMNACQRQKLGRKILLIATQNNRVWLGLASIWSSLGSALALFGSTWGSVSIFNRNSIIVFLGSTAAEMFSAVLFQIYRTYLDSLFFSPSQ